MANRKKKVRSRFRNRGVAVYAGRMDGGEHGVRASRCTPQESPTGPCVDVDRELGRYSARDRSPSSVFALLLELEQSCDVTGRQGVHVSVANLNACRCTLRRAPDALAMAMDRKQQR